MFILERGRILKGFFGIVLALLMSFNLSQAQHKPTSDILLFNVGFSKATPEDSDNSLDGNTFTVNFEKSNYTGNLAGGIALSYGTTSADSVSNSGLKDERINSATYQVVPVTLYGKFLFGSPIVKGYVGAGIGIQFSWIDFYTSNVQVSGEDSGLLAGLSVGVNYFLGETMLLNANYNFNYLGNSYYKDGYTHTFNLGLGFQFF